jgi:hypothetical protein
MSREGPEFIEMIQERDSRRLWWKIYTQTIYMRKKRNR